MLTCQQFVSQVDPYLEGRLTASQMAEVSAHETACSHCSRYLAQTRAVLVAVKRVGQVPTPVMISPALSAALQACAAPAARRRSTPASAVAWLPVAVLAVVGGFLALWPAEPAPPAGPHLPCSLVLIGGGLLPVAGLWLAMRLVRKPLSVSGAALVGTTGGLAAQLLVRGGCPMMGMHQHLLLSHLGSFALAIAAASAWGQWGPRMLRRTGS